MKSKKADKRKQFLIHYRFNEQGKIEFIDPSCDELPMKLFGELIKAINDVQNEYNKDKH